MTAVEDVMTDLTKRLGSVQTVLVLNKNGQVLRYHTESEDGVILGFSEDGKTLSIHAEGSRPW